MFPENSIGKIVKAVNELLSEHEMKLALLDDSEMLRQIIVALKPFLPYISGPIDWQLRGIPVSRSSDGTDYFITAEGELFSKPAHVAKYYHEPSLQKVLDKVPLPSIVEALALAFEHKLLNRRMVRGSMDHIQDSAEKLFGPEGKPKFS